MPNEEILEEKPKIIEDLSLSLLSKEWIPLIEASRILGLKSIRQVYRRIKKHDIQHKRVATGTRIRSYVRRADVLKSRKLALEESFVSDITEDLSALPSARRPSDVGIEVVKNVMPQIKEFISNTNNKLAHLEHVRTTVTDLLDLLKEERGEKQKEREVTLRAKKQERRTNLVRLICYLITSIVFCGFTGYVAWKMYTGVLFSW